MALAMGFTEKKKKKRLTDIHVPATVRETTEERSYDPHHFTTMSPLYIPLRHVRREDTSHVTPIR